MFFDSERLDEFLQAREVDGLLALSPPNVFYLTGFTKGGGTAAWITRDALDSPGLVVPSSSIDFVVEGVPDEVDVSAYGHFVRSLGDEGSWRPEERRVAGLHREARADASLVEMLSHSLAERTGVLLCDAEGEVVAELSRGLSGAEARSEPGAFKDLRTVKSSEEIERLRAAARITEAAIDVVADACSDGVTEEELRRAFCAAVAGAGAGLRLAHVSIGRDGAFGNANVPPTQLGTGDIVKLDVGVVWKGYASDMARCFSFGIPSEKASVYYAALLAGQQKALDLVRPGIKASELFDAAVQVVREEGIPHYDRTNVGHGIGVGGDGYDPPLLAPARHSVLESGMVLCVETPYYEVGFGGLQVEDMILVTDEGYEALTRSSRELRVVG